MPFNARIFFLVLNSCYNHYDLNEDELIGTWVRTEHGCADTLIFNSDHTFKHIYEDEAGNLNVYENYWYINKPGYVGMIKTTYIYGGGGCRVSRPISMVIPSVKSIFGGNPRLCIDGDCMYYYVRVE